MLKLNPFLFIAMFLLSSPNLYATEKESGGGSEGGGGGGAITRLLIYAQNYLTLELHAMALKNPRLEKMSKDIKTLEFIAVKEDQELTDPHFGYKTWIRILPGSPIRIEYNPSAEAYAKIVQSLEPGKITDSTPLLRDVVGFLLHELGHHYGMKEEDAWKFAFDLQKEIEASSSIKPKICRFSHQEALSPMVRREFVMKATDEIRLRSPARTFHFSHVFLQSEKPQFRVESHGLGMKLNFRADANSSVDYAQQTETMKFSLHCQPLEE